MIKIGDFSKLVGVPVPTLRYYDQVGLLKPINVDRMTGYRYYAAVQLPRLHRILALKGLGFSLEQIAAALVDGLSPGQLQHLHPGARGHSDVDRNPYLPHRRASARDLFAQHPAH